jgi:L-threonylcarbamoyladenylate synthase
MKTIKIKELKKEILKGKIFIYPTDTIYGIGCDATNLKSVEKIKNIKDRERDKPLSVIAPSINWIKDNLILEENLNIEQYLPGPYTIILKKKDPSFLKHVSSNDSIGVRIPDHKITKEIQKTEKPFITTSVNLSGEPFLTDLKELKKEISSKVDYLIQSHTPLSGKPSSIIINGKILERK